MTPEPCPACEGKCCRAENGLTFPHRIPPRAATPYLQHVCPDCDDGTYGVRSEPEPAPKPVRTAEDERADVLAWLHARIDKSYGVGTVPGTFGYNDRAIAEAFERGDHIGAAKRGAT